VLLDDFFVFFEELDDFSSAELLETFLEELLDSTTESSEDDKAPVSSSVTTGEESSEHPKNINVATRLTAAKPRIDRLFILQFPTG
jgi:hypothetical protein